MRYQVLIVSCSIVLTLHIARLAVSFYLADGLVSITPLALNKEHNFHKHVSESRLSNYTFKLVNFRDVGKLLFLTFGQSQVGCFSLFPIFMLS